MQSIGLNSITIHHPLGTAQSTTQTTTGQLPMYGVCITGKQRF